MGLLDDLFGGGAGEDAARKNRKLLDRYDTQGNQIIDLGDERATGYLTDAQDLWSGLAAESGGLSGLNMYANALGLNGADGNAAAVGAFQAGPGYEFQMNQGLDALERRANARGQLNSGNTNIDTLSYASGLANQEYGNWLSNLSGYGNTQAGLYTTALGGQAGALGDLASLAGNTTDRRLGVKSDVLTGKMGANNAEAEAKNQGLSNLGSLFSGGAKILSGYL